MGYSILQKLLCASCLEKKKKKKVVAEDGFDPSTSGLWAQHAPTAPLCYMASSDINYTIQCQYAPHHIVLQFLQ